MVRPMPRPGNALATSKENCYQVTYHQLIIRILHALQAARIITI
jgi:hypothetical protein